MRDAVDLLGMYLHLAQASLRRQRPHVRDRFLMLASALAVEQRLPMIAAYCRQEILRHNPGHLVRRWPSLEEAYETEDYHQLLKQLRRKYPPESSERLLESLGILMARERETYADDQEYAASLLGHSVESLRESLGEGSGEG